MKGGDVIMLLALRAARCGDLDHLSVTAVLMGDEEDSGTPLRRGPICGRGRAR